MLRAEGSLPGDAHEEVPGGAGGHAGDERKAAFDVAVAEVVARVEPAYRAADGWLEQTRAGLLELLRFCEERPGTARELVVDSIAWGPAVLERRGQLLDALAAALDRGRATGDIANSGAPYGEDSAASDAAGVTTDLVSAPSALAESPAGAPPPATAENLVGACISLVHTRLLQDGHGSLTELVPSLLSMIVQPYRGAEAARRELKRPFTYAGAQLTEHESVRLVSGARQTSY